jgi:hypothetical protein
MRGSSASGMPALTSSQRLGDDAAEIAGGHFRGEQFSARRIDALADHDETAVEADDDFLGSRGDSGFGHEEKRPRAGFPLSPCGRGVRGEGLGA